MFWELIIAAGAVGVSIGLWFRVPALIAASLLVAAVGIAAGFLRGHPGFAMLDTALALATLQIGYLSQTVAELSGSERVLESVERLRRQTRLATGRVG